MNDSDLSPSSTSDDLTGRLRGLRVDPEPGAFGAALHRRLVAAGPPEPVGFWVRLKDAWSRHPGFGWPALGALTGAATFALLFLLRAPADRSVTAVEATRTTIQAATPVEPASRIVLPTYTVPASKVAVINVNFAADVSVEDVTFEIALPDGLVFWSRKEALAERSFRWPGSLAAGDNVMPIAVRGERPGLYRVKARAEIAGQVVEHELLLKVQDPT
jgi:hypothetical protein